MNNIINSSGIYDITSYNLTSNNATILSTLNVSGTTTLNNVIINGSLNSNNSLNSNTTGRIHFFLEISKFFQKVMTFFEKMYPVFKKFFKNVLEKPKPFGEAPRKS